MARTPTGEASRKLGFRSPGSGASVTGESKAGVGTTDPGPGEGASGTGVVIKADATAAGVDSTAGRGPFSCGFAPSVLVLRVTLLVRVNSQHWVSDRACSPAEASGRTNVVFVFPTI